MNNYIKEYHCRAFGLPEPKTEFKFDPVRRWRFDYCWPDYKLAVEINGGIWLKGRGGRGGGAHSRPTNIIRDMEKMNKAVELGYKILEYEPGKIDFEQIGRVLRTIKTRG